MTVTLHRDCRCRLRLFAEPTVGARPNQVRVTVPIVPSFEGFVSRLHESHDVSVYEAIERLVQAGEAVGLDADKLLRMLDRGMTFEDLLECIEARMEGSQLAA